ncbi:MAG: class I SAM-dependent methyltransferase [Pirellula sp.]|nr:methyltransferase domain-containing protein [Pirellula sp.]
MPNQPPSTCNGLAAGFVGGNYFDKYRSNNPIHQWLMRGFLRNARELLSMIKFDSVLEVGCGPGDLAANIFPNCVGYMGLDIDEHQVGLARSRYPDGAFSVGSAYQLPFVTDSFDLVVACEVFEHLDNPDKAINELARVSKRWGLVSVPWEPVWRVLNMARGKYWSAYGNTPGHVQQFSRKAIRQLCNTHYRIKKERNPFPWTMILLEKAE